MFHACHNNVIYISPDPDHAAITNVGRVWQVWPFSRLHDGYSRWRLSSVHCHWNSAGLSIRYCMTLFRTSIYWQVSELTFHDTLPNPHLLMRFRTFIFWQVSELTFHDTLPNSHLLTRFRIFISWQVSELTVHDTLPNPHLLVPFRTFISW